MLDPYAQLTPDEEADADAIHVSRALRERASRADAAWRKRKASLKRIPPPQPPQKERSVNGR